MFQVGSAIAILLCFIILVVLGLTIGQYWIKELIKRCKRKPRHTTKVVAIEGGAMEGEVEPVEGELR